MKVNCNLLQTRKINLTFKAITVIDSKVAFLSLSSTSLLEIIEWHVLYTTPFKFDICEYVLHQKSYVRVCQCVHQ